MKILQIVPIMPKASGVTTFVENLVAELRVLGHEVDIVTKDGCRGNRENQACVLKRYGVVHVHDLWSPWLHRWAQTARKVGVKVVWSPHGTLTPWAMHYKWFKKKIAWMLYQKRDLQGAASIHATVPSEVEDVRRVGLKNPVIVAPLGVRMKVGKIECQINRRDWVCRAGKSLNNSIPSEFYGGHTLLFVSRVHRKKGLQNLIKAFSSLVAAMSISRGWRLRIVGPDEDGYTTKLMALAKNNGVSERIDFTGPKYGAELENEYRGADCFILPSFSENFGSVVVEAMAAGVPVIVSRGTPWQEVEERKCGWWVENDPVTLARTLAKMMALSDDERREMGARGRKLVTEKYQWPVIGRKMAEAYERLVRRVDCKRKTTANVTFLSYTP